MLSAQELEGKTVNPLADLLDLDPLAPVFSTFRDSVGDALSNVYYTDASWMSTDQGLQAAATVVFDGELALGLPGLDAIKLLVGSAQGVTGFRLEAQATLEPFLTRYSIALRDVGLSIRISQDLLQPA